MLPYPRIPRRKLTHSSQTSRLKYHAPSEAHPHPSHAIITLLATLLKGEALSNHPPRTHLPPSTPLQMFTLLAILLCVLAHLSLIPTMPTPPSAHLQQPTSLLSSSAPITPPTPFLPPNPYPTFNLLHQHLTSTYPTPLLPPSGPRDIHLTPRIVSLLVHPTLEASLHLLNTDLETARFLLRNMRAPPEYEGMLLEGVIARVQGDYEGARGWYRAVAGGGEVFGRVWGEGGLEGVMGFLEKVEGLREGGEGDVEALEWVCGREIEGVIEWCKEKYGDGKRDVLDRPKYGG